MAQLVEHNLAKVGVAGSSPVVRSRISRLRIRAGPFLFVRPLQPYLGTRFFHLFCGISVAYRPIFYNGRNTSLKKAETKRHGRSTL